MKKGIYLLLWANLVLFPSLIFGQKLSFSYDVSGNQSERRWVCINCRPAQGLSTVNKMSTGLAPGQNGEEEISKKVLKVYPNPVSESVTVSWALPNKTSVMTMDVFAMGGNRVFSSKYRPEENSTQIILNKVPPGTYLLVIRYSDNSSESIKLIKI